MEFILCARLYIILLRNNVCLSYSCDEAVERLSPLGVFHCDWTQIVTEPNCWDDAACVTVSHVFLTKYNKQKIDLVIK